MWVKMEPNTGRDLCEVDFLSAPRRIISNIQYFHCCKAVAKREGFKLTTTQISRSEGGTKSEEFELDKDIPHPTRDEKFTEDASLS